MEAKKLVTEASEVIISFEQMEYEAKRERLRNLKRNDYVPIIDCLSLYFGKYKVILFER